MNLEESYTEIQTTDAVSPGATSSVEVDAATKSIGQILKEKRSSLQIEISEISTKLRVKYRDIEALENDDLASITKHLYIPGLIRSYAKLVKINEGALEEQIRILPLKSNVENKKHQLLNIGEDDNLSPNRELLFNFFLITILLFLVFLSLYYSYESSSGNLITNQGLIDELQNVGS